MPPIIGGCSHATGLCHDLDLVKTITTTNTAANAVANHVFWLALGRERVFHDLVDPFYRFSDEQFRKRFRLRKETAQELLILLLPELHRKTKRSHAILENIQLCVALRFLTDGCYFLTVGDTVHISEASVHRIVKKFISGLCRIAPKKLKFPSVAAFPRIKDEFYAIAGKYLKASKCTLRFCACLTHKPLKLALFAPNPSNQVNVHAHFVLA